MGTRCYFNLPPRPTAAPGFRGAERPNRTRRPNVRPEQTWGTAGGGATVTAEYRYPPGADIRQTPPNRVTVRLHRATCLLRTCVRVHEGATIRGRPRCTVDTIPQSIDEIALDQRSIAWQRGQHRRGVSISVRVSASDDDKKQDSDMTWEWPTRLDDRRGEWSPDRRTVSDSRSTVPPATEIRSLPQPNARNERRTVEIHQISSTRLMYRRLHSPLCGKQTLIQPAPEA